MNTKAEMQKLVLENMGLACRIAWERTEGGLDGGVQRDDAEGSRGADRSVTVPCEPAYPVGNKEDQEKIYGNHVSSRKVMGYGCKKIRRKRLWQNMESA